MRRAAGFAAAVILAITAAAPAVAATRYAYWSYWQGDSGTWAYANTGPATSPAVDGAVDGWRFDTASEADAIAPDRAPDFTAICGGTAAETGKVRIAIVIDPGVDGGTPSSACAVVDAGLSRASALSAVSELRLADSGFVCGINGYPTSGCGDSAPSPQASDSPLPMVLTVVLSIITLLLATRNARIQRELRERR